MQRAFVNEREQNAFRKELEGLLRRGEAELALVSVRERMRACGSGSQLIDLALAADPHALALKGWDAVAATIAREDARGKAITALGIDFSCHGDVPPDAAGNLAPYIETNYYADLTEIAFSTASRADILAGHSDYGSEWQGCFVEIDNAIAVEGLSALYGAVTMAARDRDSDTAAGDAHLLAACTSAILLHLAVRSAIAQGALPRPMAVLVGSNEDFPFFDAPVVSVDEARALMPNRLAPAPQPTAQAKPAQASAKPAGGFLGRLFGR